MIVGENERDGEREGWRVEADSGTPRLPNIWFQDGKFVARMAAAAVAAVAAVVVVVVERRG
ncbi:hypothetical protein E2C01_039499 [Portunus trituberculatus]|uniref:Uncharacterized protein n=1 Tax=Portunus trituberculatus TaxID=210409 RepID=A0A5B7FN75_PORTR|nr:hypothetical protein [Portunus trituberculatus]